jgi:Domain of unknown function (DUF4189)
MTERQFLLVAFSAGSVIAALVLTDPVWSKGTVAVGLPGDVGRSGVAVGISYNYASGQDADVEALKRCVAAPDSTRALCKVDTHFENQCFAMAMDPKPGTYGVGYKVAATQRDADASALSDCRRTSRSDRSQYCQISYRVCDGAAN